MNKQALKRDEDFYEIGDAVYVKAELRQTRDYKDSYNWESNGCHLKNKFLEQLSM